MGGNKVPTGLDPLVEGFEMDKLMMGIDGKVWLCKGRGCHKTCDSHPCLIERAMREKSGAYAE